MVQVVGKRIRSVPILLLDDVLPAMEALLERRNVCGIPDTNTYFFALPMNSGHLYFFPTLQRIAKEAQLNRPELVTSTRLRKHVATMAQVVHIFNVLKRVKEIEACVINDIMFSKLLGLLVHFLKPRLLKPWILTL